MILIAMTVIVSLLLVACSSPATPTGLIMTPESMTGELTRNQRLAGQWIEVLLNEQKVLLHDGEELVGEYLVSTGLGTNPETTTYPGEYWVQSMWRGPDETAPGVFVKDKVIIH